MHRQIVLQVLGQQHNAIIEVEIPLFGATTPARARIADGHATPP